jgi:hypothetical protein
MTDEEKGVDEMDDGPLEEALMRQQRPSGVSTLEEAREEMEKLLVPGLMYGGLSEPEARVEAMNTVARFERRVTERLLNRVVEGERHA